MLLIKTGSTLPEVAVRHGDFEDWFSALIPQALDVRHVAAGDTLPTPADVESVVITGSPAMVSHREPWSEATAEWIRQYVALDRPLLGVCYGHQLLAHALGGVVGPNPRGRQIGTQRLELNASARRDILFTSIVDDGMPVNVSHVEAVLQPPPAATILGRTANDPHHAIRFAPQAWGIQFHPEFSGDITAGYVKGRVAALEKEGIDVQQVLATTQDCPQAESVLRAFAAHCREVRRCA